ncbi:hypothetical protein EYF80_040955 [Liparis tanakae]|uniref:Uncharacterized protein n=1 Tax=Liparis tanakae TaxID=230148 RepID=A0A4Z2G6G0_9TELE|nr:hypothetical protein EYF80_040955 [Liparis tanakae]
MALSRDRRQRKTEWGHNGEHTHDNNVEDDDWLLGRGFPGVDSYVERNAFVIRATAGGESQKPE